MIFITAEDRFWSKVDKSGGPDACWIWMAGRRNEYGRFRAGGVLVSSHRYAYELENGPIPEGLCACHRCDNPPCCNPAHIFIGTKKDNILDMEKKHRSDHPRGERHGRSKLTRLHVQEIRSTYADGRALQRDLADRFGVTVSTISDVIRWKNWNGYKQGDIQ